MKSIYWSNIRIIGLVDSYPQCYVAVKCFSYMMEGMKNGMCETIEIEKTAYWVRKVNAYLEKKGISFQDIFGTTSDGK